jgi:hypothetical protein
MDTSALALRDSPSLEHYLFSRLRTFLWDPAADAALFVPGIQCQMEEMARDSLHQCVQQSAEMASTPQRIAHMFLSQRTRRETAMSMVKFGSVVETRLPYLDNDLIDTLLAAPPELRMADRIQTHIVRRRFPAFLRVMNSNTGAAMGAGHLSRWLGKVRMKVLAKLGVRGYQPYERLGLWLRRELQPLVIRVLLSEPCLERGIFAPDTVKTLVNDHLSSRRNHTFLLMAMMTFEVGQRRFVDGTARAPHANGDMCAPRISVPVP